MLDLRKAIFSLEALKHSDWIPIVRTTPMHFPRMTASHPCLLPFALFSLVSWQSLKAAPAVSDKEKPPYQTVGNILYREEPGASVAMRSTCRLDIYYPENTKDFATVVWIHGGGLTEGSRSIPEKLKRQGFAVVTIDYRLSPGVKPPVYVEDAAAAVAWVFKNIERFGGSPDRIFITGHSAGGYLAMMIGLDKRYLAAHEVDANRIAGLIPLSGQAITHFTIRKEQGMSERQPLIDEMAPLYHVRADAPQMLLITGDRELELLGRYEENAYLWRMMKIAGHNGTDLQELKGLNHGAMIEPALDLVISLVQEKSKVVATQ